MEPSGYFVGFSASYHRWHRHPNEVLQDLFIDPKSAKLDVEKLCRWADGFDGLNARTYSYTRDRDRATAGTIRCALKELLQSSGVPGIIYLALHTEVLEIEGRKERFFLPADSPDDLSQLDSKSKSVIFYSKLSQWLLASSGLSSITLVTESCYSDNIMRLPFMCFVERVGEELRVRWKETRFLGKREWEAGRLLVQFAATMPEHKAAFFSTGAVYTQALCKNSPRHDLSFNAMMIAIQDWMDTTLRPLGYASQQHVLYSSRVIREDENIWSALGLKLKPPIDSEPDCVS